MTEQQPPNQLNIEISEEVAEGAYANLAIITHSHAEFVIDFVNVMPGTPKSKVKSRIILTPQHAKRFMKAMTENIQKYEAINGTIKDLEEIELPPSDVAVARGGTDYRTYSCRDHWLSIKGHLPRVVAC